MMAKIDVGEISCSIDQTKETLNENMEEDLCLVGAVLLFGMSGVIIWQIDNIQPVILYLWADSDEIV